MLPAMTRRVNLVSATLLSTTAAASAALGVLAVLDPALGLGAALAVAFMILVLADLTLGVLLFSMIAFMEVLPGAGDLSASKAAGGVLAVSWIAALAVRASWREQLFARHPGYASACLLFVTWGFTTALWAESSEAVMADTPRYALNFILVFIVYSAVTRREHAQALAAAFIGGVLLSAVYGLVIAPGDLDAAAEGRLTGADIDPNYLATWLVAGTVLGVALGFSQISAAGRGLAFLGALLCAVAMLATVSRTGMAALLVAMAAAVLLAGPRRRAAVAAVTGTVVVLVVLYFATLAPTAAVDRVASVGGGTGRSDIWTVGWRMVEANPLHGVGVGNFPISSVHFLLEPGAILRDDFIVDTPKVAHNVYLEVLAETGLPGLLLFAAILAASLAAAIRAARRFESLGDRTMGLLARGSAVAMLAVLAGCFFNSQQYSKPIWLLLAFGPALLAIARRQGETARSARL